MTSLSTKGSWEMRKLLSVAAGAAAGVGGMTVSGAADAVPIGEVQASFQVRWITSVHVGFINVLTQNGLTGGPGPLGTRTNGLTASGGHLTNNSRYKLEVPSGSGFASTAGPAPGAHQFCTSASCIQQPFGVSKTRQIDVQSGHTFVKVDNFTANPFTNVQLVDVTNGNSVLQSWASIAPAVQTSLQGMFYGNHTFDLGNLFGDPIAGDTFAILLDQGTSDTPIILSTFELPTAQGNINPTHVAFINAPDQEPPPEEGVPEPGTIGLIGVGLAGLYAAKRRRNA